MTVVRAMCALVALLFAALPAAAHHSPAMFDMTEVIVLEGTITDFSWRNPHVYLGLDVRGADGQSTQQQIEAGPASNLVVLGLGADSIKPGEHVVVEARPNRSGKGVVLGWLITKADGTVFPLHVRAITGATPPTAEASSIAGTWVPQGTAFSRLASTAREWPLTDAGRAAVTATRAARVAARSECVPYGPPAIMMLPSATIVAVSGSTVSFKLDVMGAERVVHLDQRSHPADLQPSLHGHSIGRWEGDTLVVDTAGYAAHPEGYAFDLPSSAAKHLVERFTLSADRRHLDYEATVQDPEFLSVPVTQRSQWDYQPGQQPSGLACDRESASRFTTEE